MTAVAVELTPDAVEDEQFILPASYAQQRMWFLDRLEHGGSAYNVPLLTRMRGPLDQAALEHALDALIERHESLRTSFTIVDGVPHQVVRPAEPAGLELRDVTDAPDPEAKAREIATESARTSFDLSAGRLFRATLVRFGPEDHILAFTLHHIITDAWSMGVLARELGELYAGFLAGEAVTLPELPIQYGDYAAWQQQWMDGGGLEQQLEYWKRKLAGAPSLLELPTDKPRRAAPTFRGATLEAVFAPELLDGLRALGESEGATLFMTLMAAYAILLARYCGQDDIVIGTPVANRNRVELEGLVGLLVNTLPVRVELGERPTFRELLRHVREVSLEAFSHQDLPFEKLIAELNPDRNAGHAPVTQVLFSMQGGAGGSLQLLGIEHERIRTSRGTAKFDLALAAGTIGDRLRVGLEYSTDLFTAESASEMLEHFGVLLEAIVADPNRPVDRIPLLSTAERARLLGRLAGAPDPSPTFCLHERFEEQVRRSPDAVAVTYDGRFLSYRELNERANRLAHHLRRLGVGAETLVALCLERSLELPVAILGVLKAGGAYVPLDPDYPAERIEFVLEDSGAPVLITQERLLEHLPPFRGPIVCLDRDAAALEATSNADPSRLATPDSLAYVIYTSGSTGRPKGVLVEHRNVARLFSATDSWFSFGADDVWSLLHSYAFDFSVWELWGALLYGGRLVVVPRATTRSPEALAALMVSEQVTVMNATPSLFLTAMDALCAAGEGLPLRTVVFGGEALQTRLLAPWYARFGEEGPRLVNMYGITETTVHVTYRPLSAADADREGSPIGIPIPDLQLYLLDHNLEPVPDGVSGELFVGGAGVTRGYLGRPELTAERFVPNPFGPGRLYRSGDTARWIRGSGLAFEGRVDDQVKIRGFRIELGEIQAALTAHESVAECAVLAHTLGRGDVRLAAYLVAAAGKDEVRPAALREWLSAKLPAYMVPSSFTLIDTLPLTANGKLDRAALPPPEFASSEASERVAPRTELEAALAGIWMEHLQVEQIGIDDDFFALGGHSLLAVAVVHAMHEQLERTCTLAMLFRNRTIRSLADELRAGGADATEPAVLQLSGGDRPRLFCICGVHAYQELAEELGADFSVYGVFLPVEQELLRRSAGSPPPKLSLEKIAAQYVATIREQQPEGPYMLLGFCFGGILAFEAAQQLRRAGAEVSLLIMLDSTLQSVLQTKRALRLRRRLRRTVVKYHRYLPRWVPDLLIGATWRDERQRLELIRLRIYGEALRRYHVAGYDGSTVLARPAKTADALASRGADTKWGWSRHISDIAVCDVPGDHLNHLTRPNVHVLAQALRPHLERATRSPAQG